MASLETLLKHIIERTILKEDVFFLSGSAERKVHNLKNRLIVLLGGDR